MPTVIVQNNFVQHLTAPAARAARDLGYEVVDLPFSFTRAPHLDEPPLIFGSMAFVEKLSSDFPSSVFWKERNFEADVWKDWFGTDFLNHDGRVMTVESFCASGVDSFCHVRAMNGRKLIGKRSGPPSFVGKGPLNLVLQTAETMQDLDTAGDAFIWVSPVKTITAEVRVWICGDEPITCSPYRLQGKKFYSPYSPWATEGMAAALHLSRRWLPAPNVVMDMALIDDEWKLIEFNPIHSSGWYDADIDAVLKALSQALEFPNDRPAYLSEAALPPRS